MKTPATGRFIQFAEYFLLRLIVRLVVRGMRIDWLPAHIEAT